MRLYNYLLIIVIAVLCHMNVAWGLDDFCSTDNCRELIVGTNNNGDDGSLRFAVEEACAEPGDDAIQFILGGDIKLSSPIVIPEDCQGRIFIYGNTRDHTVISGDDFDYDTDDDLSNCLLIVYSHDNHFENLSFLDARYNKRRDRYPGIGLCLMGNRNTVTDSYFGSIPWGDADSQRGNDMGIYIGGNENEIIHNAISQNKLDGMLISGDSNIIQGNYIGNALENCEFEQSNKSSQKQAAVPSNSIQESESNTTVVPTPDNAIASDDMDSHAASDVSSMPSLRSTAGCQLMSMSMEDDKPPPDQITNYLQNERESSCSLVSNYRHGIALTDDAEGNIIGQRHGEDAADAYNIIAYNGSAGIRFLGSDTTHGNRISQNAFYRNHGLGIDFDAEGVTSNDIDDTDAGPNSLINYPYNLRMHVLTYYKNIQPAYNFVLTGEAQVGTTIEIYQVDGHREIESLRDVVHIGDESGYGEGETYIDSFQVEKSPFYHRIPYRLLRGTALTTLAIDKNGDTSEFSQIVYVEMDHDQDGILDIFEDADMNGVVGENESDPFEIDTDHDGLVDGLEDKNKDGLFNPDMGELNPTRVDTDGDRISDYIETSGKGVQDDKDTNPLSMDTDCDGIPDGKEDTNGNGIVETHLKETDPRAIDTDLDGYMDSDGISPGECEPPFCQCNVMIYTDVDNCPYVFNLQNDFNGNHIGDMCE